MGMFDTILVLDRDSQARCPHGHPLAELQTKDLDATMSTYLAHGGGLWLACPEADDREDGSWRVEGRRAIRTDVYTLRPCPQRSVRAYSVCTGCEPVLVRRSNPSAWHGLIEEHRLFVEVEIKLFPGEKIEIRCVTGDRAAFADDLRRGGFYVLADDDPLAVAHREIQKARRRS